MPRPMRARACFTSSSRSSLRSSCPEITRRSPATRTETRSPRTGCGSPVSPASTAFHQCAIPEPSPSRGGALLRLIPEPERVRSHERPLRVPYADAHTADRATADPARKRRPAAVLDDPRPPPFACRRPLRDAALRPGRGTWVGGRGRRAGLAWGISRPAGGSRHRDRLVVHDLTRPADREAVLQAPPSTRRARCPGRRHPHDRRVVSFRPLRVVVRGSHRADGLLSQVRSSCLHASDRHRRIEGASRAPLSERCRGRGADWSRHGRLHRVADQGPQSPLEAEWRARPLLAKLPQLVNGSRRPTTEKFLTGYPLSGRGRPESSGASTGAASIAPAARSTSWASSRRGPDTLTRNRPDSTSCS